MIRYHMRVCAIEVPGRVWFCLVFSKIAAADGALLDQQVALYETRADANAEAQRLTAEIRRLSPDVAIAEAHASEGGSLDDGIPVKAAFKRDLS